MASDWKILLVATLATARLGMCIPALAYVLNQTNVSFFAMAISYTVIFSVLYLVLLAGFLRGFLGRVTEAARDVNPFKMFDTPLEKVSRTMGTLFLFDYVIFMAWFWRWLDKHNRMGLGKDAPTTADAEFCGAQFLMQAFILIGMLYFSVVINFLVVKYTINTGTSLGRTPELERQNLRGNAAYYLWIALTFAQYGLGILYTAWMFFMAVGLPPRISVDGFFWMWLVLAILWVLSTLVFAIYAVGARRSDKLQEGLVTFWADLLTGKLFWALWLFYNLVFYVNAFGKNAYKTGSDPKFEDGAAAQTQLFVAWQPFAVTNGALLVYMVYHFIGAMSLSYDVVKGHAFTGVEMGAKDWSELTSVVRGTAGKSIWVLGFFLWAATTYQLVHVFFIFSELLEVHYLNKRLEAWAIAYTVIFGVLIAYIVVAYLMKWWNVSALAGNVAVRTRVTAMRLFFSLTTIYFQGLMFYWYGVTKFDGDIDDPLVKGSLATRNITDSTTKASFFWWNLLSHLLGVWFIGMMLFGEAFTNLKVTELRTTKLINPTDGGAGEEEEEMPGTISSLLEATFEGAADITGESAETAEGAAQGGADIARSAVGAAADISQRAVRTAAGVPASLTSNKYTRGGTYD